MKLAVLVFENLKLFHCQRKVGFLTLYHGIPRHKTDKSGMPRGFTI
nr:MAG TPA: hypothetical protein [Caudoviricetes sp.]